MGVWFGFGFSKTPESRINKKNQAATIRQPIAARMVPKTRTLGEVKFKAQEVKTDKKTIPVETHAPGLLA